MHDKPLSRFKTLGYNTALEKYPSQIEAENNSELNNVDAEIQKLDLNYVDYINNSKTYSRKNMTTNNNIISDSRPLSAFENSKYDLNSEQEQKIKIMKKPLRNLQNPRKSLNVTNEKLKNLLEEPLNNEIFKLAKLGNRKMT